MLLAPLVGGCEDWSLFGECGLEVQAERSSPNGSITATTVVRNCGATTDFSTFVAVHDSNDPFDSKNAHEVVVLKGRQQVLMNWVSDSELRLGFNPASMVRADCEWPGVSIRCGPQ